MASDVLTVPHANIIYCLHVKVKLTHQGKRIRKIKLRLPILLALIDGFLDSRFPDCVIIAPPFLLRGGRSG